MSETERGWGGHSQPSRQTLTFVTHAREKKMQGEREQKGFYWEVMVGASSVLMPRKLFFLGQKELRGSSSCMLLLGFF